jgi:hypothetical protein
LNKAETCPSGEFEILLNITDVSDELARVFVPNKLFQLCVLFMNKAEACPNGEFEYLFHVD